MNPFKFRSSTHTLTKTETRIANYIHQNLQKIPMLSIEYLATELNTSTATLSRLARNLGYDSFKELKNDIANHTTYSPEKKISHSLNRENSSSVQKFFEREIEHLKSTALLIDENNLKKTAQALIGSEKIYIFAKGAAVSLAELLQFRLRRFALTIVRIPPGGSEIFENLVHITKKDICVVIGFGNLPIEIDIIFSECDIRECKKVFITDSETRATSDSMHLLRCERGGEDEYHSLTAPTAVIDALILEVARADKKKTTESLSELFNLKERYRTKLPRH